MKHPRAQGVEDVRKNLPALLERANRGHTVIVTKRGKPLAAIVSIERAGTKPPGVALTRLRGSGKGLWGKDSSAWIERLRKEW